MPVQFRDYYEVLGVSRDASQDEIRKAFRKLARKYHPDVAEDKTQAEDKFKEVNEAYEVLGDPEKRRKYDQLGQNWKHGSDFTPPPGGFEGFDFDFGGGGPGGATYEYHFGGTGFSDFFENLFGRRAASDPFGGFQGFPGAGGGGQPRSRRGSDIETDILVRLEEVMTGSERSLTLEAPGGPGEAPKRRTARVKVPKGIRDGQMIRCAGLGGQGTGGADAGDLYLRVRLERHPDFRVDGSDLYTDVVLTPWEAVLGTTLPVHTLHGAVKLKIPAGTETGTHMRLREKGLPKKEGGFGNLYAIISIAVPSKISEEERRLWEELAEKSSFNPRYK